MFTLIYRDRFERIGLTFMGLMNILMDNIFGVEDGNYRVFLEPCNEDVTEESFEVVAVTGLYRVTFRQLLELHSSFKKIKQVSYNGLIVWERKR